MQLTRKTIGLAGTVLAALTLGAGVASAHDVRFDTKLTARFSEQPDVQKRGNGASTDYFSGRVISQRTSCERNRGVRVFRKVPGDDVRIGVIDRSDGDGRWQVLREDPPDGTYYAKTARKVLRDTRAHSHICKRARSRDIVVEGQAPL